jgi:signal peptidase I
MDGTEKKRGISGLTAALITVVVAVGVVALAFSFFSSYRAFQIPTSSMEPTLMIGDRVFVRLGTTLSPGDLAVFRYPVDRSQTMVKRIVGVPGDHLRIGNKQLFLNGAPLNEPYVRHTSHLRNWYRDNFPSPPISSLYPGAIEMLRNHVTNGEVVVPTGKYFVLGDNRDNSLDSRYFGFVDAQDLVGKPVLVYFSTSHADRSFLRVH